MTSPYSVSACRYTSERKTSMTDTPVVFILFNRPDTTSRVFDAIRLARPSQLLLIADGPRPDRPGEAESCAKARRVVEEIDWPCKVLKNYSDVNLGCKKRISSGLDWVFEQVEEAIILEDDCLPDETFFRYCQDLLCYYRYDERIAHIGGANFQFGNRRTEHSYYFSRYSHVWGWATWRRAWLNYDVDLALWPELREGNWLCDLLGDGRLVAHWMDIFDRLYRAEIDTWDYQWSFSCMVNGCLALIPNVNLITNIGFGPDATHCSETNMMAEVANSPMAFPLVHPPFMIRNAEADAYTDKFHLRPPWHRRKLNRLRKRLRLIAEHFSSGGNDDNRVV